MDLTRLLEAFDRQMTPLVRTWFTDEAGWQAVVAHVTAPFDPSETDVVPAVVPVDEPTLDGLSISNLEDLLELRAGRYVLLADTNSAVYPEDLTVTYVNLTDREPRSFRCAATEVNQVEPNLSLCNLDFSDFADGIADDGIFRGFPRR